MSKVVFKGLPNLSHFGPGAEPEPETGTVGTVFAGTELGTGTAGTVFQEPKPEPEPSSLWNCAKTQTLSFLSLIFLFYQGKISNLPPPNPQNPWERQRKYQNKRGNSLLKINQGNPKNQGKEGQGKTPFLEEPPEPKTGTARTVPSPNRNRTEPNRGHPDLCHFGAFWSLQKLPCPKGPKIEKKINLAGKSQSRFNWRRKNLGHSG